MDFMIVEDLGDLVGIAIVDGECWDGKIPGRYLDIVNERL